MPFRKLVEGYKNFHDTYFKEDTATYKSLREGQHPESLMIACSDSRIDPVLVTGSGPGDLFVIRNVAAIVPPYENDKSHHGTSAALEYAVKALKVKRIIVMGHSLCGGVQALAEQEVVDQNFEFIGPWIRLCEPARQRVDEELGDQPPETRQKALEQAVILTSLKNILTFPWIAEKVEAGELSLHGWYFDIVKGTLREFDPETAQFTNILSRPLTAEGELAQDPCCQSEKKNKISVRSFLQQSCHEDGA